MIIGDRRRTGLPAELRGRVLAIWLGIAVLQVGAGLAFGRLTGGTVLQSGLGIALQLTALGCVLLLVARVAFRLFDVEIAGLACLACAMAVPLMAALHPDAPNPLAWQAVALLAAVNGLMARDARVGGWTLGGAAAAWLALAPIGAVMALAIVAISALKWIRNRADRAWLVHALQSLSVGAAMLVAIHWAFTGDWSYGSLAPAHLAAFAWATLIVTVVAAVEPAPRAFVLGGFTLACGGGVALVAMLGTPFGPAAPLPLWQSGVVFTLQAIGLPLVALLSALRLTGQSHDWLQRWWADYAVLTLAATLLALVDGRVAPAACALAAVPLGWQVREWTRAARNARRSGRRALALAGVAVAIAPTMPLSLVLMATPSQATAPR